MASDQLDQKKEAERTDEISASSFQCLYSILDRALFELLPLTQVRPRIVRHRGKKPGYLASENKRLRMTIQRWAGKLGLFFRHMEELRPLEMVIKAALWYLAPCGVRSTVSDQCSTWTEAVLQLFYRLVVSLGPIFQYRDLAKEVTRDEELGYPVILWVTEAMVLQACKWMHHELASYPSIPTLRNNLGREHDTLLTLLTLFNTPPDVLDRENITDTKGDDRAEFLLVQRGKTWLIRAFGEEGYFGNLIGFQYLQRLLEQPGKLLPMTYVVSGQFGSVTEAQATADGLHVSHGGDVLMDKQALEDAKRELCELEEEIEQAKRTGNVILAEICEERRQELREYVIHACGLGGEPRTFGTDKDRLRARIGMAINKVCKDLRGRGMSKTAEHFKKFTGAKGDCYYYSPETPPPWKFELVTPKVTE